jgi:hypothetical protein
LKRLQQVIGVLIFDWLRYEVLLRGDRLDYMMLRNRHERLGKSPGDNIGYVCLWPFTSKLHAPLVWPSLGQRLLRNTIRDSSFASMSDRSRDKTVDISVIIGHKGFERLPLLLCTLKYLASQRDVKLECIVVEQDNSSQIKDYLPTWVDYHFQKYNGESKGYNRSAVFNYGVRLARGEIVLLHDNDILVPSTYCKDIVDTMKQGYDVVNPKRFVYYLTKEHTKKIIGLDGAITLDKPEYILQNLEAGGSVAIKKDAFIRIGGMDEAFIGWGGEDNEFWWRCATLERWIWGFTSVIHLWHKSQPLKEMSNNVNIQLAKSIVTTSRKEKISQLIEKNSVYFRED